LEHFGLKRADEEALLNIPGHSQIVNLFFDSTINDKPLDSLVFVNPLFVSDPDQTEVNNSKVVVMYLDSKLTDSCVAMVTTTKFCYQLLNTDIKACFPLQYDIFGGFGIIEPL
jgi:hypothetical protein